MSSDCAGRGGRVHAYRARFSVADVGTSLLAKRSRPVVARAVKKEEATADTEDMRYKPKPRVRIEDQEGSQLGSRDETEAAKRAADAAFEAEERIQLDIEAEQAAIRIACIAQPRRYVARRNKTPA